MSERRWDLFFLALILLYIISFRLLVFNHPFSLDTEGYTSFFGVLARNYLSFSWHETWGIPILTVGHIPGVPLVHYPTHPPLVPLLIAPCYFFFGFGDWQTRLPTSIASVAAVYLLFLLLDRFSTRRIALLGAALYAAAPMTLYFGGSPEVVYMPLVLFVLLSIYAYINFHSQPCRRTFLLLMGAFFLSAISDWPAFIIVPVFLIHFVATSPRQRWPWILAFCLGACSFFFMLYLYIMLATGDSWTWMFSVFRNRCLFSQIAPTILNEWLPKVVQYNRSFHTLPLLVASFTWLIALSWRFRQSQPGAQIARILLAWGGLHVLMGYQAVFLHDWWWAPLTPGLAVSAALMIDWIMQALADRGLAKIAPYGAVLAIGLFASWTALTTFQKIDPFNPKNSFVKDLGKAIQIAAPDPNDLVLLSWAESPPQLWFYANRPLRLNVFSLDNFEGRLQDDTVDLPHCLTQPWKAQAAGMVLINNQQIPSQYGRGLADLRTYLKQNYAAVILPSALAEKFDIFDLTRRLDQSLPAAHR
jgi:hypothetical protein